MSFKRDGNDENLLKNLNHQRVRELLGSHIPQDEAKLLSNGRLACMICLHRPVFDTINMLASHRKGKRHMLELSKYIKCKEDAVVRELQRKRPHSDDITSEDENNAKITQPDLLATLSQSPMLGSKHSVAKLSTLRHKRKPVLEIQPTVTAKVPVLPSPDQSDVKSASATVRHYLKSMSRKSSLEKVVEKNRENYGVDLQQNNNCDNTNIPAYAAKAKTTRSENNSVTTGTKSAEPNNGAHDYEVKLRMSGWIKDLTGKWIKDPNVEFDSDEDDAPPAPT